MKFRFNVAILVFCAICFNSCKDDNVPVFEMDMFFDINIPAGLNTIESHFFIIEDVPTFAASLMSANNVGPDDIGSILGATGKVETRFSGLDLDFIQNVGVHALDQEDQTNRREAFYIFNDVIPLGTKTDIDMIPSILNLKDQLLLEETVDLEFKIDLRSFLPQELDLTVQMKFFAYRPE